MKLTALEHSLGQPGLIEPTLLKSNVLHIQQVQVGVTQVHTTPRYRATATDQLAEFEMRQICAQGQIFRLGSLEQQRKTKLAHGNILIAAQIPLQCGTNACGALLKFCKVTHKITGFAAHLVLCNLGDNCGVTQVSRKPAR